MTPTEYKDLRREFARLSTAIWQLRDKLTEVGAILRDQPTSRALLHQISEAAAAEFGVDERVLHARVRSEPIVTARHVAMYFAHRIAQVPSTSVGKWFGRRDHCTVLQACQHVADLIETEPAFAARIRRLATQLEVSNAVENTPAGNQG